MMLYAITGGPCTGKTTTIDTLAQRGHIIVPEAARQIIQEEQQKPNGILPWKNSENFSTFQQMVIQRQYDLEQSIKGTLRFCDRSGLDGLAYCNIYHIIPPHELLLFARNHRYTNVFLLDQLPYVKDAQRTEEPILAKKIHEEIEKAYLEHGYNLIRVPVLPPKERADYIEQKINLS